MQAPSRNPHGGTPLIDACYTALMVADADADRALLLAFTDGVDTSSWLTADAVLQAARRSNLVAYAVSTSDLPDSSFLHKLSDVTGGVAFEIASTADLRAAFSAHHRRVPAALSGELLAAGRAERRLASCHSPRERPKGRCQGTRGIHQMSRASCVWWTGFRPVDLAHVWRIAAAAARFAECA
jgi:hypothetical protein